MEIKEFGRASGKTNTLERLKEVHKKGMRVSCSRCQQSETYVAWIDKKKWPWGAMTMVVQAVIDRLGWKTIDTYFVCPDCQTENEKKTDYSKSWYCEYYEMWNANQEIYE